ncbi:Glycosyltransferase involved in cell wall bisynthesis [Rhodoblastus acidophilus]|uniref:Glycosyltransferase involved in cell wall bisynthesis n=1 Tax=Rhodoblastus acidophilus TaxID=1074 RepID=A0A212Q2Q9_RHOAC|nr:glycosyltransferase [Rhodoblastus acidophilus]PPQ37160.1 hypothetical protein CKO16_15390 [Rhodoblastus acidophilus]RAI18131.1 hypothetical protein CH337_14935 [Rhodoblastus acidophilus]SNB53641.1 Glycosyltransferase involved in cell wall bisynthesis [Rhodoblastus acidophilus]
MNVNARPERAFSDCAAQIAPGEARRVAVIGTNDPRNVSGGRYHALMLAFAVAAIGWDAHLVTDHTPGFFADFEPLSAAPVTVHLTRDFSSGLPDEKFDWVIVIPTGIFLPDYYESCLDFAARSGARLALVNFESGDWFNALAPEPRDPRLWDYWRRLLASGGLVLSSARESDRWARGFYQRIEGDLRFEVWQPPVNSVAARRFDAIEKDGSLVAFVRPQDGHKGAGLLTKLDPALLAGRTLHLVSGRDLPDDFRQAIDDTMARAKNARAAFHCRVSDNHKFRLLSAAQAVLFPSRFEGYGYPPVEAAYAGAESVAFPLAVLKETVGAVAHFAPTADLAGFETALAAALAAPERRQALRRAVFGIADFHHCAWRLGDILLRSADRVALPPARRFRVAVGPFQRTPPLPPQLVRRDAPVAPFPPTIVSAVATTAGEALITGRAWLAEGLRRIEATVVQSDLKLPVAWEAAGEARDGLREIRFYLLAPKEIAGRRIALSVLDADGSVCELIEMQVDRIAPANPLRPIMLGVSENAVEQDSRRLRGWVLARDQATSLYLAADGAQWSKIAVEGRRNDIAAKYPAYATALCEFRAETSAKPEPDRDRALLICLAGGAKAGRAIDAMTGWPPAPKPWFAANAVAQAQAQAPAAAPSAPRQTARPGPRRPKIGEVELVNQTDPNWRGGVARTGGREKLGAVLIRKGGAAERIAPGVVLRFANGAARRVTRVEAKDHHVLAELDGFLAPSGAQHPAKVAVHEALWSPRAERSFILHDFSDRRWRRGVWNVNNERFRRGFSIKTALARELGLEVGARLRFAASGWRVIVEIDGNERDSRVWLDDVIKPFGDGAPNPIQLAAAPAERPGFALDPTRAAEGWPGGVLAAPKAGDPVGRTLLVVAGPDDIRRGDLLECGDEVVRVLSAAPDGAALRVVLDRTIQPCGRVCVADECDYPDGASPSYLFPDSELPAKDPLFRTLGQEAARRGAALPASRPQISPQRRALVLSSVAPCPANQGNRVVTRNLIRRLIGLGYHCDVLVQNWVDAAATAEEFGSAARFFVSSYPEWDKSPAAAKRREIAAAAQSLQGLDQRIGEALQFEADTYHPFFNVRDETVDLARTLYAQHAYDVVVCNYTHMMRVAAELNALRPLPPTAVLTHDALSRLPRSHAGVKLDLGCRAASPELERDALNSVRDAVIVAISRSEADYFREIGVQNPIVVTEYDAAEEMAPHRVAEVAFSRRTLIFHGSANPMNVAGMSWFFDECWSEIVAAVPDAKLVVCGGIGAVWRPEDERIEIFKELPRDAMLAKCAAASVAINPCVAGTGLKIKTVETVCLGLPAVCLPTAVDGLEDDAPEFARIAADSAGFVAGCVELLTNFESWARLHKGALATAERRFSAEAVYAALDDAMGWRAPPPVVAAPAPAEDTLEEVENPIARLEADSNDAAAQFSLGVRMSGTGQGDLGWPMVEKIAEARRGDWRVFSRAAEVALTRKENWRAACYAGAVTAQRPTLAAGYALMARALTALGQKEEALTALQHGLLACPGDAPLKTSLVELLAADRPDAAARWRAIESQPNELGAYIVCDARRGALIHSGFAVESDGALALRSGTGALLMAAPHRESRRIRLALDLDRTENARDIVLRAHLEHEKAEVTLRADGPRIQTVTLAADFSVFASGFAQFGLGIAGDAPLSAPLRLIGFLIEAAP